MNTLTSIIVGGCLMASAVAASAETTDVILKKPAVPDQPFTITANDARITRDAVNRGGPVCGDVFLDIGETCDDGNMADGDGCSSSCQVEAGYDCSLPTPVVNHDVIADRSFEAGTPNPFWFEFSTNYGTPLCENGACGGFASHGSWWAYFGGFPGFEQGVLSQTVTIPATADRLSFDLFVVTCDSVTDRFEIGIDGNLAFTTNPCTAGAGYNRQNIDISAYADGNTHLLEMISQIEGLNGERSDFFVDDLTIETAPLPSSCTLSPNPDIIIVNTVSDGLLGCPTSCTLREAVALANPLNEIRFSTALNGNLIVLAQGAIVIDKSITIAGNGAANTIVASNATDRVFEIVPSPIRGQGAATIIRNLTVQNGHPNDGNGGGGIRNTGQLLLQRVVVTDNVASDGSGDCVFGADGGGIFNAGTLMVDHSEIRDNRAGQGSDLCTPIDGFGNGTTGGKGGGIANAGTLTVTRTTVSGNHGGDGGNAPFVDCSVYGSIADCSTSGGTGGSGGGLYNSGSATIEQSTVSANVTGNGANGGVIQCSPQVTNSCVSSGGQTGNGGGLSNNGNLTIANSTISSNRGGFPGGLGLCQGSGPCIPGFGGHDTNGGGLAINGGTVTLDSVTITANVALGVFGGGGIAAFSPVVVHNTIIAGNFASNSPPDCYVHASSAFNSLGFNLIGDTSGCPISGVTTGNILNVQPELGVLAGNGGPTQTHKPLSEGVVVDAGDCGGLTVDQRALPRPAFVSCDIGAAELQPLEFFCTGLSTTIPDNDPTGVTSVLALGRRGVSVLADVDVFIDVTHTYVGDLVVTLTNPATGVSVTLLDRPGLPMIGPDFGCPNANIFATLDDGGISPAEDQCAPTPPAIGFFPGPYTPTEPLSAFQDESLNADWSLTVVDAADGDTGSLNNWCLVVRNTLLDNQPPSLALIGDQTIGELQTLLIPLLATDPDGDSVSFFVSGVLPPSCQLTDNGNGTGFIACNPGLGEQGDYLIFVTVVDDSAASAGDEESLTIAVTPFNQPGSVCSSPALAIPDEDTNGVVDNLMEFQTGVIADIDVIIQSTHTYVGDLRFTLENVATGTTATLIDRPELPGGAGSCPFNNINVELDDEAATPVGDECNVAPPAVAAVDGVFMPTAALSVFDGEPATTTWRLTAFDLAGFDTGTLDTWCVITSAVEPDTDSDGVPDSMDNCTEIVNADQRDSNGDLIGNACDADINGDCVVNFLDSFVYSDNFFLPGDLDTDNNGDNFTNFADLTVLSNQFFGQPGPSAAGCDSLP